MKSGTVKRLIRALAAKDTKLALSLYAESNMRPEIYVQAYNEGMKLREKDKKYTQMQPQKKKPLPPSTVKKRKRLATKKYVKKETHYENRTRNQSSMPNS